MNDHFVYPFLHPPEFYCNVEKINSLLEDPNIDINDYPLLDIPKENVMSDSFPEFISTILQDSQPDPEGIYDFISKFVLYYVFFNKFKEMTDGNVFLFVAGLYIGTYKTYKEALIIGEEIKNKNSDKYTMKYNGIYIGQMYVRCIPEHREFHLFELRKNPLYSGIIANEEYEYFQKEEEINPHKLT